MRRNAAILTILSTLVLGFQAHEAAAKEAKIHGEVIHYEVGGVPLTGYLAYDEGREGPRPGVLVVHEWWGHNEYARKRAEMLAGMGYTAFALDMYGEGKLAEHPGDAQKFAGEVASNMEVAVARFEAAREILENHPTTAPDRTAAIGYCFGGGVVLHMARIGSGLDAVASFHGSLDAMTAARPEIEETRIFVAHGSADPFVSEEVLAKFKLEMKEAGVDLTFRSYEGAAHSFTNPGATAIGEKFELPLAYDEKADKASWADFEGFLAETFASE